MFGVNDSMFNLTVNFLVKVSLFSGNSVLGFCVINPFLCLQPAGVLKFCCSSISKQINLLVL